MSLYVVMNNDTFTLDNFNSQIPGLWKLIDNEGLRIDFVTTSMGIFKDWTEGGTIIQHGEFWSLIKLQYISTEIIPFFVDLMK